MQSSYATDYSPCCDAIGHRPATDTGNTYFCFDCGQTYQPTNKGR